MNRPTPIMRLFGAASVLAIGGLYAVTKDRMTELRAALASLPPPMTDTEGRVLFGHSDSVLRAAATCVSDRGLTPETHALLRASIQIVLSYRTADTVEAVEQPDYWYNNGVMG